MLSQNSDELYGPHYFHISHYCAELARYLSKEHLDLSFAIYVLLLKRQIVTLYSSGQGEIPYRR